MANIQYTGKNYSASAVYAYDEKGNVKSVTDGGRYTSYGYDGMSRLTRENNQALGFTKTYEYDANGNILTVKKYAYTTAVSLGTPEETAEYTYGTGARRDRLVSVVRRSGTKIIGNEEISGYDTLGNPCNYMGNVIEWEYGRRMRSCGGITYKYGADGIRTEKTVNGTVHKYYAEGETLHFETRTNAGGGMQRLWYYYDGSGICGIEYNGTVYYFQKNLQGDVTRVYDGNGNLAAQYVYDAWGNHKVLNANGTEITDESFIGNVNPIRYRGYYYDEETGLYYLQSRYYDPEVGRFLNADDIDYADPTAINGLNLYSYCDNDPVNRVDPTGHFWDTILDIGFLIWGIYDVIKNPTDWKNWVSLGIDLVFAVIPFIPSGAGKIVKAGDNALDLLSAANKLDNFHDLSKITVVGETMNRVGWFAKGYNAADNLYDGFKAYDRLLGFGKAGKVLAEIGGKGSNALWLMNKLRNGYNVIDTGLDVFRAVRSSSYYMERVILFLWKTRHIWKLPFNYFL